ncbi:hypothetical protein ACFW6V_09380 [Streptomyces sp. NPDC058734]|uniref:hypothetical protein n=1 Tax=Streptomyces sp. NPDC058734 TaxID=3346615 RepID=UPI00368EA019
MFRWLTLLGIAMLAFGFWSSPEAGNDGTVRLRTVERRADGDCLVRYAAPWEPGRTRTAVFRCGAEEAALAERWPWRGDLYEADAGSPVPEGVLGLLGTFAAITGVALGCHRHFGA